MSTEPLFADYHVRTRRAEALAATATYVSVEHPYTSDRDRGFKAYEVRVDNTVVCIVYQALESVHRKAGRIITSTRRVKRWSYSARVPIGRAYTYYHNTRIAAVEHMLERMLHGNHDIRDGKLVAVG